jgi:hypothetical protein
VKEEPTKLHRLHSGSTWKPTSRVTSVQEHCEAWKVVFRHNTNRDSPSCLLLRRRTQLSWANIYSADETCICNVQKLGRILGPKREKQDGSANSRKRGQKINTVCPVGASGNYTPTNDNLSQEDNIPSLAKECSSWNPVFLFSETARYWKKKNVLWGFLISKKKNLPKL